MKYIGPAGKATDAAYVDGNRNAGLRGDVPPAAAIEHPQRELNHLIEFAGLTPGTGDLEQVRKAIAEMISIATGGGDTSNFVTFPFARAQLPFFPNVLSADGKINVTSPSGGTVQVPTSVTFQHRGIYPVSTSDYIEDERTFTTLANKTYHMRWNPVDGFSLKDLANSGYNASVLAETNFAFDAGYDDMLFSRVVTNGSNVATITNLVNKAVLAVEEMIIGTNVRSSGTNNTLLDFESSFNWARRPTTFSFCVARKVNNQGSDADFNIRPIGEIADVVDPTINPPLFNLTRYKIAQTVMSDFDTSVHFHFAARA